LLGIPCILINKKIKIIAISVIKIKSSERCSSGYLERTTGTGKNFQDFIL
jgi:hypothetical protein